MMRFTSSFAFALFAAVLACMTSGVVLAGGQSSIDVKEGDYGGHLAIKLSSDTVSGGSVTIHDANTDEEEVHELVLIRTDLPAGKLPYDATASRVREDKLNVIGEIDDLGPGKSDSKTFNLKPGRYVLICNEPGHYKQGMYAVLHVGS